MKSIDKNDSDEIRTRVTAVKGRCLNRLTMGPYKISSPSRARTYNPSVNSRVLYHWAIEDCVYLKNWTLNLQGSFRTSVFGQAIGLLVMVSWTPLGAYTSILSTLYSPGGLPVLRLRISHLEGGFTLRCLQRLSLPDLATLPWHWHANRCTSDPSIPVLSY